MQTVKTITAGSQVQIYDNNKKNRLQKYNWQMGLRSVGF